MWLFTKDGFYSITESPEFCGKDELQVRARKQVDLERLTARLKEYHREFNDILKGEGVTGKRLSGVGPIRETPSRDYRWRMAVSRGQIKLWLARVVGEIDYSNFKDASTAGDAGRHHAYLSCWRSLYRWQKDE